MMTALQKRYGKSINQAILWLMLISMFGLGSIAGLFKKFYGSSSTVAEVNGYEISAREFKSKYQEESRRLEYFRQQFGPMADQLLESQGMSTNPEELALNSLVQEKLLEHIADKLGVTISADYVQKKLEDPLFVLQTLGELVPPYLMNNQGSIDRKALVKHLQRQGIALTDFDQLLENILRRVFVVTLVSGGLYIPEGLIKEALIRQDGVRTYEILTIPVDQYRKELEQEDVSSDVLLDYYNRYNNAIQRYYEPEKRTGDLVSFTLKKDQEQEFMAAAQQIASMPWDTSAEDAFLKKFNASPKKVVSALKSDVTELAKRLFGIEQGQKAAFVENGKGFMVTMTGSTIAQVKPFESVKAQVKADYLQEQAMMKMRSVLDQAAQTFKNDKKLAAPVGFTGSVTTYTMNGSQDAQWQKLAQQNMNIEALKNMAVASTMTLGINEKAGYIVLLKEVKPVAQEAIAAARGTFERALYSQEMSPFIGGFVASLQKTAKIKLNQSMFYQN